MKKIANKKLGLAQETIRVLTAPALEAAIGGTGTVASPTTTVRNHSDSIGTAPCHRHSVNNAAAACRTLGVETAMCVRPPGV
jgi:hypothetical protein